MFNLFKKKGHVLGTPAKGKAVPLSEVNDPTFAEEMLGKGAAVIPSEGKIYAPADGEIGDHVKKGDLLLEVDLEKVKAAGYDIITPVLVCNTPDYKSVENVGTKDVAAGDDLVIIE